MTNRAILYGLRLESDLPLPELVADEAAGPPDVQIRLGKTGLPPVPDEEMYPVEGGAGFRIAGVGSYAIRRGSEIVVEPEAGAPDRNVRLYLLGSAMGMLLHQRGLLPLHANAVEIGRRAFAFMGPPGAGKSTLAAWLERAGHQVLADDVCVVTLAEDGGAQVRPGLPRLRLWRESLEALGRSTDKLSRSYVGDAAYDKYDLPLPRPDQAPLPLGGVLLIADGEQLGLRRLAGAQAVAALIENSYRGSYLALAGGSERHWRQCMHLASVAPVLRFERPGGLGFLDETVRWLEETCTALPPQSRPIARGVARP